MRCDEKISAGKPSFDFAWSNGARFRRRFGFNFGLAGDTLPAFGGSLKQDESSLGSVAHRFRTTRWTMVLRSAQSQARGFQAMIGRVCLIDWYPHYRYIRRRTVSERAEIDDELCTLCAALTACEDRLGL